VSQFLISLIVNEEDESDMVAELSVADGVSLDELNLTHFLETTDVDANEVFTALKELSQSDNYGSIQTASLEVMEYRDSGRLEKGYLLFDTKQKSFRKR